MSEYLPRGIRTRTINGVKARLLYGQHECPWTEYIGLAQFEDDLRQTEGVPLRDVAGPRRVVGRAAADKVPLFRLLTVSEAAGRPQYGARRPGLRTVTGFVKSEAR